MSRAVTARRSAIRKATSESWRINLSVSCDTYPRKMLRIFRGAGLDFASLVKGNTLARAYRARPVENL
jgi:hypothetical protein